MASVSYETGKAVAKSRPTPQQFAAYQSQYDYLNQALFAGKLPPVILNFSRRSKTLGFFAPARWDNGKRITHEISLNPSFLRDRGPREVAATLVHEMAHLWQAEFGTPSRTGYHNHEWAAKMEEVGLVPSSTGEPGGDRVGQKMSHYIDESGAFAAVYASMPESVRLPWQCSEPEEQGRGRKKGAPSQRNKTKYTCPVCEQSVWGKPEMNLICGDCQLAFEAN